MWADLFLSLLCAPNSAVPLPDLEHEGWDGVNAGLGACVLKTVQRVCALRQGGTPEAPQSPRVYGEETLLAYRALDAGIRVAAAFEVALKTALDVHCWPLVATALEDRLHSGAYHDLNAALRRDLWECDNEALVAWGEEHVKGHYNTKAETGLLWALGTGSRAGQAAASHTGFLVRATTDKTLLAVSATVEEAAKGKRHRATAKGTASLKRGMKVAAPFITGRPTLENFDQVRQTTYVDEAAEAAEAAEAQRVASELAEINARMTEVTAQLKLPANQFGTNKIKLHKQLDELSAKSAAVQSSTLTAKRTRLMADLGELTARVDHARPVFEHECEQAVFDNGLPTYVDVVKYLEKQLLIGDSAKLMGVIRDEHLPAVDPPAETGDATGQEPSDGEANGEQEDGDPEWLADTLNFFAAGDGAGEAEGGPNVVDADAPLEW